MGVIRDTINRLRNSELAASFPRIAPGDKQALASQSTLVLAYNLQGTNKTINFSVLETTSPVAIGIEKRLKINDLFTMLNWGMFLVKAGSSTSATDTEISSAKRYTNPNALVFTGTGESGILMNAFNGFLSVTVDRQIQIPFFDCQSFLRVGDAQKGVGPSVITTDDAYPNQNYGFAALDPEVTLNGGGTPEIQLQMPNSVVTSGTSSTNLLVLVCRGILWQNASNFNA